MKKYTYLSFILTILLCFMLSSCSNNTDLNSQIESEITLTDEAVITKTITETDEADETIITDSPDSETESESSPISETETESDTEPESTDDNTENGFTINLMQGGKPLYSIVKPANADDTLSGYISDVYKAMNSSASTKFKLKTDDTNITEYEVLIGDCDRDETKSAREKYASDLEMGKYIICTENDKIVILADSDDSMYSACEKFTSMLKEQNVKFERSLISDMPKTIEIIVADENSRPCIIKTEYETSDIVIADIIATDKEYGADPTGEKDSTKAIQKALLKQYQKGGGTVYLPKGTYLVSSSIEIPAFCTLRGDWQNPDEGTDYGTVIIDIQPSSSATTDSLFVIRGSAGVVGLTVFYPEQNISSPIEYPYTFYVPGNGMGGYMLSSIQNCTVLNGYKGIGGSVTESNAHEMMTVDNFYGTFLAEGMYATNEAEVGTFKTVRISADYWANVPSALSSSVPTRAQISEYMKDNTTGLILGDLEWDQFADIKITDCNIGINIIEGKRIQFSGMFIDTYVTECKTAFKIDNLDSRWGICASKSVFEGSEISILNSSSGLLKLTDVSAKGDIPKPMNIRSSEGDTSNINMNYSADYKKPVSILYTADITAGTNADISPKLQLLLDEAGKTGGVVYIKAGVYHLENPVVVPANVELRGVSSVPNRDQSGCSLGTVFVSSYGMGKDSTETALITLSGENSGANGFRVYYTTNKPQTYSSTPYVIRGSAKGVYCVNCSIVAASYGIDFTGCDNHFIKRFAGAVYCNAIKAGGENGSIEGCLQNGNAYTRSGLTFPDGWFDEGSIFQILFPILRSESTLIILDGAKNEKLLDNFAYGAKTVLEMRNSSDITVCNIGGDNIGDTEPLIKFVSSSAVCVNMLRYNGISYTTDDNSDVTLLTRLTINDKKEGNIINGEEYKLSKINAD